MAGQKRIAAAFQLGRLEIGLRLQVCHLSLFLGGIAGGLGLNHLLLGFGLIGLGFAKIVFLLRGVEFDYRIAGRNQLAGFAEFGDGEGVDAGHGGDQGFGVAALELAASRDGDGDTAFFYAGGGQIGLGGDSGSGGFGDVEGAHRWRRRRGPGVRGRGGCVWSCGVAFYAFSESRLQPGLAARSHVAARSPPCPTIESSKLMDSTAQICAGR